MTFPQDNGHFVAPGPYHERRSGRQAKGAKSERVPECNRVNKRGAGGQGADRGRCVPTGVEMRGSGRGFRAQRQLGQDQTEGLRTQGCWESGHHVQG